VTRFIPLPKSVISLMGISHTADKDYDSRHGRLGAMQKDHCQAITALWTHCPLNDKLKIRGNKPNFAVGVVDDDTNQ